MKKYNFIFGIAFIATALFTSCGPDWGSKNKNISALLKEKK